MTKNRSRHSTVYKTLYITAKYVWNMPWLRNFRIWNRKEHATKIPVKDKKYIETVFYGDAYLKKKVKEKLRKEKHCCHLVLVVEGNTGPWWEISGKPSSKLFVILLCFASAENVQGKVVQVGWCQKMKQLQSSPLIVLCAKGQLVRHDVYYGLNFPSTLLVMNSYFHHA